MWPKNIWVILDHVVVCFLSLPSRQPLHQTGHSCNHSSNAAITLLLRFCSLFSALVFLSLIHMMKYFLLPFVFYEHHSVFVQCVVVIVDFVTNPWHILPQLKVWCTAIFMPHAIPLVLHLFLVWLLHIVFARYHHLERNFFLPRQAIP